MVEIWKNSDYENYQFSNTGKARNSKTGKILKPYPDKQGYLGIAVYIKESKKQKRIQVQWGSCEACLGVFFNPIINPCLDGRGFLFIKQKMCLEVHKVMFL